MIYRDLREAIEWFRAEWQAGLPMRLHEGAVHVHDEDHLGGPAMTERFERYIDSGVMWVADEVIDMEEPKGDVRHVIRSMATGSQLERQAARFLFVLACMGFDPEAAGRAMRPVLGPEYSPYYAEKAITRLYERMTQREERRQMPWQLSGQFREARREREPAVA